MRSKYEIFKIGIKDVAPHLLSVFPFGIIFGAIGIELGFSPLFTYATSLIIFGGASQIVFLQLLSGGACSGIILWFIWQVSTIMGIYLGSIVPEELGLKFAIPLTFIAIIVNELRKFDHVLVMLISGLAATFFYNAPFKTYIIISPLIGLFAAMIINKLKK